MNDFTTIEQLVEENFRLARFHANRQLDLDPDEALSAALEGLHNAAKKFDPNRGIPFGTMASRYIKWALARQRHFNNAEKRNKAKVAFSLDAPVGDLDDSNFSEIIPDEKTSEAVKKLGYEADDKKLLMEFFHKLSVKQQKVLSDVFGMGKTIQPLDAIASEMKVSRSRVSQIAQNALRKLRRHLTEYRNELRPDRQSNAHYYLQN